MVGSGSLGGGRRRLARLGGVATAGAQRLDAGAVMVGGDPDGADGGDDDSAYAETEQY